MLLVSLVFVGGVSKAFAAGKVELVPTSPTTALAMGQSVTFDVQIDFAADGGTLGGGVDLVYDSAVLEWVGFTTGPLGDPAFARDPDEIPGGLVSWAVGSFDPAIPAGTMGSVEFKVLDTPGATTFVELRPTAGVAGPWISGLPPYEPVGADFLPAGGVELTFNQPPEPTLNRYEYEGVVAYCLPAVCDGFAAFKVGSVVAGYVNIVTAPNTVFDTDDVGTFQFTVTNPDIPLTPNDPPPTDAEANPLYVFYFDEINNNATDIGTVGMTDDNNLFTGMSESFIQVNGTALQGFIFQDLTAGFGCFNPAAYNYCDVQASIMIWEGAYSLPPRPNEIFANGFESTN